MPLGYERFEVKVGSTLSQELFLEKIIELGYEKISDVEKPGEFNIRGNLVDIFPIHFRSPLRVEFGFERIDSIRDFTINESKTLQNYSEVNLLAVPLFWKQKRSRTLKGEPLVHFRDLEVGDFVVHVQHGVGKFVGLKMLSIKGKPVQHLAIEYSEEEMLYVPTATAYLVERYIGLEGRKPKLHKLHSKEWEKTKSKVKKAVDGIAKDMLQIQAKRSVLNRPPFKKDNDWQKQFEADFPFEETPDQKQALKAVKHDLESSQPMDRLLCGDVGYGKTEVAMRAAFKAVMSGKQVAILVPTTILAEQHGLTFQSRSKKFPVRVGTLSRFRTKNEQKEIVAQLKEGSCDVVIGTHRLLSPDVQFKNLGLVIIDEEQRFGVKHKERLKHLRALVDVLTLTATPIPRTLYLSLVGVKDMSAIQTPPQNRMPIVTEVLEYDEEKVKQSIRQEIARKGQIYFVHNRVQSIEKVYAHLKQLVPEVKIQVAHGQMSPHTLEAIMLQFIKGEVDCLVATNIIESGLDIPNVNTMIVNNADQFGLADLYQLRGRVGRMNRQAYAYFFIPKHTVLSQEASKRLEAINRFTELGSGFRIALEDLEIRGAGNILGHEQSGFIYQVGFDLYCRMLKQAVESEKKQR
jgi:transcription-repair coupling factor (superfamily II helicase)